MIPCDLRETCICKSFGSSLVRPALQWYTDLPNNSIVSFAQLIDTFIEQFASGKKLEKLSNDLYKIRQWYEEPLKDCAGWFHHEKVSIPNYNQETVVNAFRKGLLIDSELYIELTKFNYTIMNDVFAWAWIKIRWEEDEVYYLGNSPQDYRREERRPKWSDKYNDTRVVEPYPIKWGLVKNNRQPFMGS